MSEHEKINNLRDQIRHASLDKLKERRRGYIINRAAGLGSYVQDYKTKVEESEEGIYIVGRAMHGKLLTAGSAGSIKKVGTSLVGIVIPPQPTNTWTGMVEEITVDTIAIEILADKENEIYEVREFPLSPIQQKGLAFVGNLIQIDYYETQGSICYKFGKGTENNFVKRTRIDLYEKFADTKLFEDVPDDLESAE